MSFIEKGNLGEDLGESIFQQHAEPKNGFKIEFPAISENEAFARLVISGLVAQLDPIISDLEDVKTAVSEAVTNAIVHGYDSVNGKILMQAELFDDTVKVVVEDFGKGIADIEQARIPLFTTASKDERSGLGFTVMETFMDSVYIYSEPHIGTRVVMFKQMKSPESIVDETRDE